MADFNRQQTGLVIVQEVCGQLGLPVPATAIAGIGTDATPVQMVALLNNAGRRLCKPTRGYKWTLLTKTFSLDTVPAQNLYDVPADWDSFDDMTGWNFSQRLPMIGPATAPEWMAVQARNLGGNTISVIYRMRGGKMELFFVPASGSQNLQISYTSRAWVRDANDPLIFRDYVSADADVVLWDAELIQSALKLAFLKAKGFDTSAAQAEYDEILEAAMNADSDAPVLTSTPSAYPLISPATNVPDTGYGA
jgi:hypothetical protein